MSRMTGDVAPFELLADYGVPVVDVRTADSVGAVLAAAEAVGYPVALKTVAALHKSDVGGVVLDIRDRDPRWARRTRRWRTRSVPR